VASWPLRNGLAALDAGPAVCGWKEDQRWTLAPVATLGPPRRPPVVTVSGKGCGRGRG
jgi:hypothetical protein